MDNPLAMFGHRVRDENKACELIDTNALNSYIRIMKTEQKDVDLIVQALQNTVWKRVLQLLLERHSPTLDARLQQIMNHNNASRPQIKCEVVRTLTSLVSQRSDWRVAGK